MNKQLRIAFGSSLLAHLLVLAAAPPLSARWKPAIAALPEEPSVITIVSLPPLEATVLAPKPTPPQILAPPKPVAAPPPKPIVVPPAAPVTVPEPPPQKIVSHEITPIATPVSMATPAPVSAPMQLATAAPRAETSPASTLATKTSAFVSSAPTFTTTDVPSDGFVIGTARYRRTTLPTYPPTALKRRMEGVVILRVKIDPRGFPITVEVTESSGQSLLDTAAVRAVKEWEFEPETCDGRPVPTAVEIPVRFSLKH